MDMRVTAVVIGLVVAGAPALAEDSLARKPAAPTVTQTVAVKKPLPKKPPPARRKEETDPLAEVPSFSAEAVGWQLIEDPATGARLGLPEKLVPHAGPSRTGRSRRARSSPTRSSFSEPRG